MCFPLLIPVSFSSLDMPSSSPTRFDHHSLTTPPPFIPVPPGPSYHARPNSRSRWCISPARQRKTRLSIAS
ncbi:hypothetical protein PAXRUDRAFT_349599 [Paxillus rubicundulus Ve08.2h10]|uniref:Uncharacterized protein n=1 Tax=Paxillus rubicundulus Ve08.2h10 TaxID=930991 RepID=A0A0D0CRL8_9AGAM|nr:hypothetical protein PAXRUDRAFT_349599 [Paxillus rubicundulus Ve08.2h10]